MATRATVRLSTRCDNACRFCAQAGVEARDLDDAAWDEALVQARDRGADEVTFVGGEPLLVAGLERAIARARELGFRAIGVQSNGWALGEPRRVEGLRAVGLTDVHLSVHGARAAVHDYHVGRDGAFERIMAALGELRRCGVVVVVRTVLTRSNARVIGELPAWLGGHGVRAWGIAVPRVAGGAAREFDRVVPRLGVAMPFALHALDRARRIGIAVGVIGAPRCVLGPWDRARISEGQGEGAFAEVCAGCSGRAGCQGVDARYLGRFGGDELRAIGEGITNAAGIAGGEFGMTDELGRMFVGVGEEVDVAVTVHESVRGARRRLPVLEKAQPGVEETRGVVRTAAALFPGLGEE